MTDPAHKIRVPFRVEGAWCFEESEGVSGVEGSCDALLDFCCEIHEALFGPCTNFDPLFQAKLEAPARKAALLDLAAYFDDQVVPTGLEDDSTGTIRWCAAEARRRAEEIKP